MLMKFSTIYIQKSHFEQKDHTQIADDSANSLGGTPKFGKSLLCTTTLYFNYIMSVIENESKHSLSRRNYLEIYK